MQKRVELSKDRAVIRVSTIGGVVCGLLFEQLPSDIKSGYSAGRFFEGKHDYSYIRQTLPTNGYR